MTTIFIPQSPITIDQVPLGVRDAIHQLFATHTFPIFKCDLLLESLLRYAQVENMVLEQSDRSTKIVIHNLLKTYHADRTMQGTCCYQTLHTFVRLLYTLGILKKQVHSSQPTTYLLSRDPGYRFQVSAKVLAGIDCLTDPEYTKNLKMRKKARDVKGRLLLMTAGASTNLHVFPQESPTFSSAHVGVPGRGDSLPLLPAIEAPRMSGFVDSSSNAPTMESPRSDVVGDSIVLPKQKGQPVEHEKRHESPRTPDLGDSSPNTLAMESTRPDIPGDSSFNAQVTESTRYDVVEDSISLPEQKGQPVEHEKQHESPKEDKNLPNAAPSSIDSIPIDRNSSQKELELEAKTGDQWIGSEEELSQEAIRYLTLLDGPEYVTYDYMNTRTGKQALGGYKRKIRRSPRLARVAAINALLQRIFYDLTKQKKPLENTGKWFHGSFDRYADPQRPMEITGEILDWAKSPYTLEEIASVLPQERKRQETQWWFPEAPHLPFSSCVVTHQYLRDDASALRMSIPEQQQDIFLLETGRQNAGSRWMSCTEAERLADEIRRKASWYLDGIHAHREPRLGENAYVVEASIAETTFSVVYTLPRDWWQHHQDQVHHQAWEEQRKDKKRASDNERRLG